MSQPSPSTPTTTTSSAARKPRVSLAIATAFGLGYLPKAPGTWGSLAAILIYALTQFYFPLQCNSWRATSDSSTAPGGLL